MGLSDYWVSEFWEYCRYDLDVCDSACYNDSEHAYSIYSRVYCAHDGLTAVIALYVSTVEHVFHKCVSYFNRLRKHRDGWDSVMAVSLASLLACSVFTAMYILTYYHTRVKPACLGFFVIVLYLAKK